MFYFKRGLSENQRFLINNKFLIFSVFFFLKIKTPVFFFFFFPGEPCSLFHYCFFFQVFSFFTTVFWGFSLLIAFFQVIIFLHLDCFFCWSFLSDTPFLCCYTTSATDSKKPSLPSGVFYLTLLPHICEDTTSATDLRQIFLPPEVFYFTFLYDIWHNDMLLQPAYKDFLGADNFSLKLQDLPTLIPFKTQPWYICLFESHSV